jgi:chitinase
MNILSRILTIIALMTIAIGSAKAQTPPDTLSVAAATAINLTWTASATTNIAGYNLYRAPCTGTITLTVCSTEGSFIKLNSAPITSTTASDLTAITGSSYSYYVTALCPSAGCNSTTFGESLPSNHVAIVVIAPLPVVAIIVNPITIISRMGGTTQLTDLITGTTNMAVTWSTTIGTISSTGLFTAPLTGGTGTITVTSQADTTKSASATVTIILPSMSCIRTGTTGICTITNLPVNPQTINDSTAGVSATF